MHTVRIRVMALLTALAVAFMASALAWQSLENGQASLLAREAEKEKTLFVRKITELRGRSLETHVYLFTFWDEMARFVQKRDTRWADATLAGTLAPQETDNIWAYDKQRRQVYTLNSGLNPALKGLALPGYALGLLSEKRPYCHFFMQTPQGLVEVRGATIHKTQDEKRTGPHYGYYFAARLWSEKFVTDLKSLTNSTLSLDRPGRTAAPAAPEADGRLTFDVELPDWQGRPVALLHVKGYTPTVGMIRASTHRAIALFLVFVLSLLGLLFVCLLRWVSLPLRAVSHSLQQENPAPLARLTKDRSEFGGVARLIEDFFRQKAQLVEEIAERVRAQAALARARDELEERVRERTQSLVEVNATLEETNATLEEEVEQRQEAELQIRRQYERLLALHAIDEAITSSPDLRFVLSFLLGQVTHLLNVDAAAVLLRDAGSGTLGYAAGHGFRTGLIQKSTLRAGQGLAGRAAETGEWVRVKDPANAPDFTANPELLLAEGVGAYYAVPLIAKGQVQGVLELFHRAPLRADEEWEEFLATLAGQAAIAIDNARLFDGLQRSNRELMQAYDATIEGWSRALDLRDRETEGHSRRVTEMTLRLALAAGFTEAELVHVRRGALLHDIGKMGIPDSILLKPGKLTDEERAEMQKHTTYALEMLSPIEFLRPALAIPYAHHEKWDGTGYPRGLAGEEIPVEARLFAIVDVWDALRSDRPYREGWPEKKVLDYLREQAGTHFDPRVVEAFLSLNEREAAGKPCAARKAAAAPPEQVRKAA